MSTETRKAASSSPPAADGVATWGPKLFIAVLAGSLAFFWWLLIHSGGVVIHHG